MNLAATGRLAEHLHAAIHDALRDSTAYASRGILVSTALTARHDLHASNEVLYRAMYTLFCAMPWRLARDTTFFISTVDVDGGIELEWEGREESAEAEGALRDVLRAGPHGDLVDIALAALEQFCDARAGAVRTDLVPLPSSPRFPRGSLAVRRVSVFLPVSKEAGLAARARLASEAST